MNQRLIILAVVMMIAVVSASDIEERGAGELARFAKKLSQIENRLKQIESNRMFMLKGRDGHDGKNGQQGPPGRDGRDGKNGKQGPSGRDGRDGKDGKPGPSGPRGSHGPSGKHGARGPPGRSGGGVEYIRWGKTSCPAGAGFVYKGRIGGGFANHHGGGSNYICLPEVPKYLNYRPGDQHNAYIYGAEYKVKNYNLFSKSNLHNHDAPCVACHVKKRSSKLMIPATYKCPSGWTREYYGYLMAESHDHNHSSGFICVDRDAEAVSGSHADRNGALLYPVEGVCGSLPCQPYVQSRELTCVVCTK